VTANYTYDAAGNVTNDGVHSYTYDAENRVVSVDGGATAQYRYDHQNRRVTKIIGAAWTHYIWEGSHVIGEHDGTTPFGGYGSTPYGERSSQIDYIYAGSKLVSSLSYTHTCHNDGAAIVCTTASTSRYYLSDRLSTRLVLDSSGNVLGRMAHLPFGEDFAESGTQEKHHFTSYERDAEAGADYAINRQYSQSTGRFNRADPLASSGKKEAPQTWNRYAYTAGDPINQKDSLGLMYGFSDDPCDPFGPELIIDGFEFSREMLCFAMIAAPLLLTEPDPEPKPTCTVFVQIKKIKGAPGIIFHHAFLLTQDNQTGVITYFGARSSRLDNAGIGGVLVGRSGDPNDRNISFGDLDAKIAASFGSTFLGTCDSINQSFRASTGRINAQGYPYDPTDVLFGHNSNAFAFTLLADYGFSMLGLIGKVTAWEALVGLGQPDPLPGWFDNI
jgi:RHS repeat-associated protein